MMESKENFKKICSFYVSEYHLVTMLLPYIKQNLDNKKELIAILEQNLEEYMNNLLSNVNLKEKTKEKILNIKWNKTNEHEEIENRLNTNKQTEEIIIIVTGKQETMKKVNKNIRIYYNKNRNKKITIINCYEVTQFNNNIKEILDEHDKLLNTSGEKEIEEVFEGYKNEIQDLDIANNM